MILRQNDRTVFQGGVMTVTATDQWGVTCDVVTTTDSYQVGFGWDEFFILLREFRAHHMGGDR